jgi:hypothetical protein
LDLIAKPAIGERWQGRGPAILLNDQSLWRLACQRAEKCLTPAASARLFFAHQICPAVALHEFGHVCDDGFTRPEVMTPERYAAKLLPEFRSFLASAEVTPLERPDLHHGATWIRCTLHLIHRAVLARPFSSLGLELHFVTLVTEGYRLSPTWKYEAALGDEPERLAGLSFAEIVKMPPPEQFTALFSSDQLARKGSL